MLARINHSLHLRFIFLSFLTFFLFSCGGSGSQESAEAEDLENDPIEVSLQGARFVDSNDQTILEIMPDESIARDDLPETFNIAIDALTEHQENIESVALTISGCAEISRTELNAPYTVQSTSTPFTELSGDCVVTAMPQLKANVENATTRAFTVRFTITPVVPEIPVVIATDTDNDGIADNTDNCQFVSNPSQVDSNSNNVGDACEVFSSNITAEIKPSRTECASPCTIVFSAENTRADGLDENQTWSSLGYYWDFDTNENDTYGGLYQQNYTYVDGDTAYESGHVPLVSKTFLCNTGVCQYSIGLRVQDAVGNYDDEYQTINVRSESNQWSANNTICVSNTLNTSEDWSTGLDKACPAGATQQDMLPLPDEFQNKLVLLKKGDVFIPTAYGDRFGILNGQSNFKLGFFGNNADSRPELKGHFYTSAPSYKTENGVLSDIDMRVQQQDPTLGTTDNAYFEGLRIAAFEFPYMFNHVGLHDIDMDYEAENNLRGGRVSFPSGHICVVYADIYDCDDFPFPVGAYISKVNIVGSLAAEANQVGVNIVGVGCLLTSNIAIVDSSIRKAGEHNIRLMGWYRLSIMRNHVKGQHYLQFKQKVTTRPCTSNDYRDGRWIVSNTQNVNFDLDIEGRTRADIVASEANQFIHHSRYQVTVGNIMGEDIPKRGSYPGGAQFQTNAAESRPTVRNIILTKNIFYDEPDKSSGITANVALNGYYNTCVDNQYSEASTSGCAPNTTSDPESVGILIDPEPVNGISPPGTL